MQNTLKIKRTKTALAFVCTCCLCGYGRLSGAISQKRKRNSALGSNVQIYGGGCAFGNIYRSSCRAFSDAWRGHKRLVLYAF